MSRLPFFSLLELSSEALWRPPLLFFSPHERTWVPSSSAVRAARRPLQRACSLGFALPCRSAPTATHTQSSTGHAPLLSPTLALPSGAAVAGAPANTARPVAVRPSCSRLPFFPSQRARAATPEPRVRSDRSLSALPSPTLSGTAALHLGPRRSRRAAARCGHRCRSSPRMTSLVLPLSGQHRATLLLFTRAARGFA